jgi:hypothetical protein
MLRIGPKCLTGRNDRGAMRVVLGYLAIRQDVNTVMQVGYGEKVTMEYFRSSDAHVKPVDTGRMTLVQREALAVSIEREWYGVGKEPKPSSKSSNRKRKK